jgi:hypothetical protein
MTRGYNYITRANRGRRYPIAQDGMVAEARYLTTACLQLRANSGARRCQEETAKALAAYRRRHNPAVGCPTGWRQIALGHIHSAGIADQYAEYYRDLVACRREKERGQCQ